METPVRQVRESDRSGNKTVMAPRAFVSGASPQPSAIRVLHVIEAIDGGVKRHVMSILASLDRSRFELEVAGPALRPETGEGATFVADLAAQRVPFHAVDMARAVSPRRDLAALAKLCLLIRRRGYDVVHG